MNEQLVKKAYKMYCQGGDWENLYIPSQKCWREIVKMIIEEAIKEYKAVYFCGCDVMTEEISKHGQVLMKDGKVVPHSEYFKEPTGYDLDGNPIKHDVT